jgi:hypothetical protein
MGDESRIEALEARVAALEQHRANQARAEQTRRNIAAALSQPGGVPDPGYTKRDVDPRELGVVGGE